jgi:hypothetical protein
MMRGVLSVTLFGSIIFSAPAYAVSAKDKMETCNFGADDQKLTGAARKAFISKCMANEAPAAGKAKSKKKV